MRRVLMTTATRGPGWTGARELCRALAARDVAVTLATLGAPLTEAQWHSLQGVPGLRVEQSTWRTEGPEASPEDLDAAGAWLLELEARDAPDVVHLHQAWPAVLPWRRRPLVAPWDGLLEGSAWRVARGLRAAGLVVTPTQALLDALELHHGPLPATQVIPPALRPEDFPPAPVREPVVLATGDWWDEALNLPVLESVAPWLHWPVLVAGGRDHPDGGQMRARAVRLLGPLPPAALASRLGRASIFVLPARQAPTGQGVLEAALAGCALVLADIPALREWWEDAAVFVPPDDTRMLGRALRRLGAEPTLRARLSTLARTRALRFSPERLADAYLAVYARLDAPGQRAVSPPPQRARAT